jgi:hypothetical protein
MLKCYTGRGFSLSVGLMLLATGCVSTVHPPVHFNASTYANQDQSLTEMLSPEVARSNYLKMMKKWTRHQEVFNHFEGRLFVSSTLLTPEVEVARSKHHQHTLSLNHAEWATLVKNKLARSTQSYLFFVTLSSSDLPKLQKSNRLDLPIADVQGTEDELRVHLMIDNHRLSPTKIDMLSFKRAQSLIDDFPYISPVKTGYWIYFEAPEKLRYNALEKTTHKINLRFSSIPATALLEWDVVID